MGKTQQGNNKPRKNKDRQGQRIYTKEYNEGKKFRLHFQDEQAVT